MIVMVGAIDVNGKRAFVCTYIRHIGPWAARGTRFALKMPRGTAAEYMRGQEISIATNEIASSAKNASSQ